jgi:hypothetical protein
LNFLHNGGMALWTLAIAFVPLVGYLVCVKRFFVGKPAYGV